MTDFFPGDLVTHVNHPESLGMVVAVQEQIKLTTCVIHVLWNNGRLVKVGELSMLLDLQKV